MKRLALCMAVVCGGLQAAVTLPSLISDHMILQRDAPVRIWGRANPGEAVTVRFAGQEVAATAASDGRWEA
jgi:sialate O-acetylesterase